MACKSTAIPPIAIAADHPCSDRNSEQLLVRGRLPSARRSPVARFRARWPSPVLRVSRTIGDRPASCPIRRGGRRFFRHRWVSAPTSRPDGAQRAFRSVRSAATVLGATLSGQILYRNPCREVVAAWWLSSRHIRQLYFDKISVTCAAVTV